MNPIDPEILRLLTKLQPQIKKAMGPWQHGDHILLNGLLDIYCADCLENKVFSPYIYMDAIRIPLPSPLPGQDASRTLTGMIKGFITLQKRQTGPHIEYECLTETVDVRGTTEYLCLLKAIEAQQEVKG